MSRIYSERGAPIRRERSDCLACKAGVFNAVVQAPRVLWAISIYSRRHRTDVRWERILQASGIGISETAHSLP